jgi:hypothetical protein
LLLDLACDISAVADETATRAGRSTKSNEEQRAMQEVPIIDLATLSKTESTDRLMALEPLVKHAAATDPSFEAALLASPIQAITARFGAAAMPNEGEFIQPRPGGGFRMVFPVTDVKWTFLPTAENDELPDELLEQVSAGNNAIGPTANVNKVP